MESLSHTALKAMSVEQLKEVFTGAWNQYREYFYLLERKMSYFGLKKWSETLPWCHPAARYIDLKLHQREFRGKRVKTWVKNEWRGWTDNNRNVLYCRMYDKSEANKRAKGRESHWRIRTDGSGGQHLCEESTSPKTSATVRRLGARSLLCIHLSTCVKQGE